MKPANMTRSSLRYLSAVLFSLICCSLGQQDPEHDSTGLVQETDKSMFIVSTLDGSLIAINQRTGDLLWRRDDEPAIKVPYREMSVPIFLPDPRDGSLYLFGPETEVLKKLPFTIPQLVASSPCRSSDGILYSGRKTDTWFRIDPHTGDREQLLGFEKAENTCPLDSRDFIFMGRTEYNVIMIDSKRKDRKWNVTFYDYSAVKLDPTVSETYDLVHFAGSSTGRLITLDKKFGTVQWDINLESPVVAIYALSKDGLISMPFSSVADCALNSLKEKFPIKSNNLELFQTLYVGEHKHGLYATPSLVDSSTTTKTSKSGHLLLDGPLATSKCKKNKTKGSKATQSDSPQEDQDEDCLEVVENKDFVILGHYEVPEEYKPHNQPLLITGRSDPASSVKIINSSTNLIDINFKQENKSLSERKGWRKFMFNIYQISKNYINQNENKEMKLAMIIFFGSLIAMFWYLKHMNTTLSQKIEGSRDNSRTGSSRGDNLAYAAEEVGEGSVRIGKIIFNTDEVLGKGCEGTFVYKGEFDGRSVAVKRLLPDCFTFADREVALLRETDAHANVVRYFCTEQDRMFRYIALELAEATLQDYIVGRYERHKISAKSILKQATSGLAHLHTLDIVHRDIKPHNVLLSTPGPRGEVRAMISDFGLCKKLQSGRMSFSRKSGVTGTEGWIAPEILNGDRTTCAVDIFSLGCVFYYVLSDGKHPFGDQLRRQANILNGDIDLSDLQNISENDKQVALTLIKAMLASNPKERPPAQAVHDHPLFWKASQVLTFFQDISDRVEKDSIESPALQALESNNQKVVQGDWRLHIDVEVATDLRKYRSYRGESVRDLLRALRNKKHHYRELTPEAQKSLGEIPDKFTDYWLSRFPHLLIHSWCAMQSFRTEPTLRNYYDPEYEFLYKRSPANFDYLENEEIVHRVPNGKDSVDWSPNRTRYRGSRRKYEKKKPETPSIWTLPPAS